MAKFCEKCGAQLNDDAKFCRGCGTPTEAPATSVQQPPPAQPQYQQPAQYQKPQYQQPAQYQQTQYQQQTRQVTQPAPYTPAPTAPAGKNSGWILPYRIIASFLIVALLISGVVGYLVG